MRVTPRSLSRATWLPTLAAALVGAAALAPNAWGVSLHPAGPLAR